MAEDTDLNEEELDLNVSRKMSIRALNVATMHRLAPGSINTAEQRISNAGLNTKLGRPLVNQPQHRPSMLLRASNTIRRSTMNRASRVTGSFVSNMRANMMVAAPGRDSTFDVNVSVEDDDFSIPGVVSMSVHRCSMIKKYNIETFFSPAKTAHQRAATETQQIRLNNMPLHPSSARAQFNPADSNHPSNSLDQSQVSMPEQDIDDRIVEEEEDEDQSITELVPEVASNKEFLTDETFTFAETLKAKPGMDFLSMAAAQDTANGGENQTE